MNMIPPRCTCDDQFATRSCIVHGMAGKSASETGTELPKAIATSLRNATLEEAATAVRNKRLAWTKKWRDSCKGKDVNSTNYADILSVAEDAIRALKTDGGK